MYRFSSTNHTPPIRTTYFWSGPFRSGVLILSFILAALTIVFPTRFAAQTASAAPHHQTDTAQDPSESIISAVAIDLSDQLVQAAFVGCAGPEQVPSDPEKEQQVAELTNIERAKVGLPPLKLNETFSAAGRYHAADMAQDDYFRHDTHDRNGEELVMVCPWYERFRTFVPDGGAIAENLAFGQATSENVVQAWMESEGHRENILHDYSELGVSYFAGRWTQNFADRADVYPVIINGEAGATDTTAVTIYAYGDWQSVRLRNDGGSWSNWQPFSNQIDWQINASPGVRTLDVELSDGARSVISSDTIEYTGPERSDDIVPTPELNVHVYMPLVSGR